MEGLMKRAMASALTLFCVACGGGDDTPPPSAPAPAAQTPAPASDRANEPPEIVELRLDPEAPRSNDPISVELVVRDPDQDRVRTTVEWYRNDQLVEDESGLSVDAGTFTRGDRVYAMVFATDGAHDVSGQTPAVSIANGLPRVRSLRVTPDRPTALDQLQAEIETEDPDGDRTDVSWRWLRNGQPVPDATTSRLPAGVAKRGDTVAVQVNLRDSGDETGWIQSKEFGLANAAPTITSQPNYELAGSGEYSYEIGAKDPDGDEPLRYEVVQGPPGLKVDVSSGLVSWRVPSDAKGVYPIELGVSDPHGGKTTQSYSLSVDWDEGPKNAKAPARSKPAVSVGADDEPQAAGSETASPAASDADDEGDADYTNEDQEGEAEEEEF
jgi:hypothetical protein